MPEPTNEAKSSIKNIHWIFLVIGIIFIFLISFLLGSKAYEKKDKIFKFVSDYLVGKELGLLFIFIILVIAYFMFKKQDKQNDGFWQREPMEILEKTLMTRYFLEKGIIMPKVNRESLTFWQREKGGLIYFRFKYRPVDLIGMQNFAMVVRYWRDGQAVIRVDEFIPNTELTKEDLENFLKEKIEVENEKKITPNMQ